MAHSVFVAKQAEAAIANACAYINMVLCEPSAVGVLLEEFDKFIDAVGELPDMYPLCDEERLAAMGIRKAVLGGYIALYVHDEDSVTVIAFFHQMQGYAKLV